MKNDHLIICGLPKSFDLLDTLDYINPPRIDFDPDALLYDAYPVECDEDKGEDAALIFKYNESATGIYVEHNSITQTLKVELPQWAVEADVLLYSAYINTILKKHKRARLYSNYAPLPGLSESDTERIVSDCNKFLKKQLTTREGFTMEGINHSFTLLVEHLRPAPSIDMQTMELQQMFVRMQWEKEND